MRSLGRALRRRGHEVTLTGPVWRGHHLPTSTEDIAQITSALNAALALSPDVLFNFRASSLPPELVRVVRAAGVRSQVWLPDDPVLYGVCYRDIVDEYDDILHCAGEQVMQFYEERHGRSGVNFPFWTGWDDWPDLVPAHPADIDLVFFGNCDGPVRSHRYDIVSSLPFRTRIYGRVPDDPHQISGGVLKGEREVAQALSRAAMGLNIPQYFRDYVGSEYEFPELADFGHFEFPSRVIQFARLGLPVVSLQSGASGFPEFFAARDRRSLIETVDSVIRSQSLVAVRSATRARFQASFSADVRAEFLERLVLESDAIAAMSVADRAVAFSTSGKDQASVLDITANQPPVNLRVPLNLPASGVEAGVPTKQHAGPRRILVLGEQSDFARGAAPAHIRALSRLGHHVFHVQKDRHPSIFTVGETTEICDENLWNLVDRFRPDSMLTIGSVSIAATTAAELARRQIDLISVSLADLLPAVDRLSLDAGLRKDNFVATDLVCLAQADRSERATILDRLRLHFDVQVLPPVPVLGGAEPRTNVLATAAICVIFTSDYQGDYAHLHAIADGMMATASAHSLLCIERFDGIEEFFEDDTEIIAFSTGDDLVRRLLGHTRDQARFTATRRRGATRTIEHHLYEHRWAELLADADRRDSRPVGVLESATKRIVVSGYFGAGNLGDEAILRALIEGLERRDRSLEVVVAAENPARVEKSQGRPGFHRQDLQEADAVLETASAVVLGGGGLWHDYSLQRVGGVRSLFTDNHHSITGYAKVPLLGAMRGLPWHAYGVGVGPLTNPRSAQLLRYVAESAESITVRDEESKELLSSIAGWKHHIDVQPDLAYALELKPAVAAAPAKDQRPRVLVSLRPWELADSPSWLYNISRALQRAVDEFECDLIGLPMQSGSTSDEWVLERAFAMVESDGTKQVLPWSDDLDAAIAELRAADVVVAMRLHAALLAHRAETPAIGLTYDPKVRRCFADLGVPDRALALEASADEIVSSLSALIAGDPKRSTIADRVAAIELEAQRSLDRFAEALAASGPSRYQQ